MNARDNSPESAGKPAGRRTVLGRLRLWLFTGLLVLAPSAITLYIFYRLLNAVDNLLGRYMRFEALDYHRIPGAGLLATLLLLVIVGAITSRFGSGPLGRLWDRLLMRIPGIGILYGSTKSLGEALLSPRQQPFQRVVLVPWPEPGSWRIGFITGEPSDEVAKRLPGNTEVVFVPSTPNPASGFVHYVAREQVIYLDWPIEFGLQVIVSGGVVQPPAAARPGALPDSGAPPA
jgi:uncharacterized membrane protein